MIQGPTRRPILRRLASLAATAAALASCGSTATADPHSLISDAKRSVDSARALHFTLSSSGVEQAGGAQIVGGEGDAKRPAEFTGKLDIRFQGLPLSVSVVSVGHTFYVKLPLSNRFETADPTKYGFNDPAVFLDPDRGLSSMLAQARSPSLASRDRYQGEELDEVKAELPGDMVAGLLTSADARRPRSDVPVTLGINVATHELRRAVLTGLFFDPRKTSTYTLILDRYGEDVNISRPA
ncbi:MAG: LppX_LprAFG lipoprotein [Candidatus Dormibacteria bacterium]